jgi:hypothetical protein
VDSLRSEREGLIDALEAAEARLAEAAGHLDAAEAGRLQLHDQLDTAVAARDAAQALAAELGMALQQVVGGLAGRRCVLVPGDDPEHQL